MNACGIVGVASLAFHRFLVYCMQRNRRRFMPPCLCNLTEATSMVKCKILRVNDSACPAHWIPKHAQVMTALGLNCNTHSPLSVHGGGANVKEMLGQLGTNKCIGMMQ